jgi:hypothetical protein
LCEGRDSLHCLNGQAKSISGEVKRKTEPSG